MCAASADFCPITADNFENSLASDGILAHFFNDFLSLPSFPECLLYNQETRLFEEVSVAAQCVSRRLRSILQCNKSQLLTDDLAELAHTSPVDNHYTLTCLDREEGIQWIVKERLPFFLQSDSYIEYRLAKLFQHEPNLCVQRRKSSSGQATQSAPQLRISSQINEENKNKVKAQTCSQSDGNISAKEGSVMDLTSLISWQNGCITTTQACSTSPSEPQNLFSKSFCNHKYGKSKEESQSSRTAPSADKSEEEHLKESSSHKSSELQLESSVATVLCSSQAVMDSQPRTNTSACFSKSVEQLNYTSTVQPCESKACVNPDDGCKERLEGKKERQPEDKQGTGVKEHFNKKREVGGRGPGQKSVIDMCCHGIGCHDARPDPLDLDGFKEFLRGTAGEKLFYLWMDIERLKSTQHRERKTRHLVHMRNWYLLSSSQYCLHVELLSRLGLNTSPCWTEEKLRSVQPLLTESLLYYWAPRFRMSHCVQENLDSLPGGGLWTNWCVSALLDTQPHHGSVTLHPVHHDMCQPQTQFDDGRIQLLSMEKMLEALSVDLSAGSYFTTFCVQTGNQLWENAIHFWTDLQHYRELFYQDGLDPYRVQREAQLLYSTYLLSSARKSIGVDEEMRREVYDRMMPAFEELFDKVEEHTLNILLEPWMLLVHRDRQSFQKVRVWEEVHSVGTQEFRELQSLYEESQLRRQQVEQSQTVTSPSSHSPPSSLSEAPRLPDSWSKVPLNYHGYRLGSLLRHRHEVTHFMSFLQDREAGIHLSCWLDLEEYRRTIHQDKAVRLERSSQIATKYLNRKYFFGPDSPATTQQQSDILQLAGGLEHLKLDCLSDPVVMEIQDIVKSHIEKKWLPQFLSTADFAKRQKRQPQQPQAADGLLHHFYRRRRARRAAWKTDGLWMSSSKESLLLRQILLNPVTCVQFQHFVYLKGGFLENDVLFWLEVQRYKDLCHSHSDEATIQHKISTIINCFINSSTPPALQIDIPPEQAQHILEKRRELGPYIFREAQLSVFNELLKVWPEFQELRSSIKQEQLLPLLQEKRVKYRARVRRQRRREEEDEEKRRAQADLEGLHSGTGEEEDTGDEEGRSEKRQLKMKSGRVSLTPTTSLLWSYSKYMAALKREEVLLRRQLDTSFSTDCSSDCSVKSAGSELSFLQSSTESKHQSRALRSNVK